MDRPDVRVGDAERDVAYRARTTTDLRALLADLPEAQSIPAPPRRSRVFLPGVAAFHEERRLRAGLRAAYASAWSEMVPRLELRGYFVTAERSPMRIEFLSRSGHGLTVTFRSSFGGGTIVTAFGHAPRAVRKAFATMRD